MLIFKKEKKEKKNLLHFANHGAGFLKHSVEPRVSDLEYSTEIASWLHFFSCNFLGVKLYYFLWFSIILI